MQFSSVIFDTECGSLLKRYFLYEMLKFVKILFNDFKFKELIVLLNITALTQTCL